MVGADAALPLPWLAEPLGNALRQRQGHALLVHGPQGVGQFELATTLAQAWLCESSDAAGRRPCGTCAACRLVQARSHPDLLVLLPEALRESLGWSTGEPGEGAGEKASKAKPSKEIKVDAVRAAVAFAQTTSARGRGKVVVMHPAESMNGISANTLLKTLEEPPGDARFLLSCAAPDALLPTIRSRCQSLPLGLPPADQALAWLAQRGVADPAVMLAAAGGQPLDALDWVQQGVDAAAWLRLPAAVLRGDAAAVNGWPLPRLVEALQKLCHDALCAAVGAAPRYFPVGSVGSVGGGAGVAALSGWSRELVRVARQADHPWVAALMAESLLQQARQALTPAAPTKPARRAGQGSSIH